MIIKITPENDAERARMKEVEHVGVKEFFIFGNKKDSEGESIDFHDWTGSYRYLIGSLYYFTNQLADEQAVNTANKPAEINLQVPQVPQVQQPKLMELPTAKAEAVAEGFIKKSNAEDGEAVGVVEVQEVEVEVEAKPDLKVIGNDEMVVDEEVPNDSSKEAEEPF